MQRSSTRVAVLAMFLAVGIIFLLSERFAPLKTVIENTTMIIVGLLIIFEVASVIHDWRRGAGGLHLTRSVSPSKPIVGRRELLLGLLFTALSFAVVTVGAFYVIRHAAELTEARAIAVLLIAFSGFGAGLFFAVTHLSPPRATLPPS